MLVIFHQTRLINYIMIIESIANVHTLMRKLEQTKGESHTTKDGKQRSYLRVSEKEAKYFLNLACYEEHFFID